MFSSEKIGCKSLSHGPGADVGTSPVLPAIVASLSNIGRVASATARPFRHTPQSLDVGGNLKKKVRNLSLATRAESVTDHLIPYLPLCTKLTFLKRSNLDLCDGQEQQSPLAG